MISIVLALCAASMMGLSAVLVRKRLDESNFFSVSLVIAVTNNIILWPLVLLIANLRTVNLEGVLFFVIGGMLAPGITSLLYFKGMEVVGVSVNASIFATYPMYSSIFAVLLLSEIITTETCIGIGCIVVGVIFIERSLSNPQTESKKILKKGLIFSLLATLTRSISVVTVKYGLNIYNDPLLSAALGYSSTFLLYLILLISSSNTRNSMFLGNGFRLFWKAGIGFSLGWVFYSYALSHERVSIVAPLTQTQPLFILFFAYLYLRKSEYISLKLVISTFLIIIGVILLGIR